MQAYSHECEAVRGGTAATEQHEHAGPAMQIAAATAAAIPEDAEQLLPSTRMHSNTAAKHCRCCLLLLAAAAAMAAVPHLLRPGVPAEFRTSAAGSDPVPYSALSLRLDCSSCRTAKVMAHYQPVFGAEAGPADTSPSVGWANTPGWFDLANRATPTPVLATQGTAVHLYAYCTSGASLAWSGDVDGRMPAPYQGCSSSPKIKMTTLQLSGTPGSDFVARLACDGTASGAQCFWSAILQTRCCCMLPLSRVCCCAFVS